MCIADTSCVKIAAEFMPTVRDIALMPLYDKLFDLAKPPRFVLFAGSRVPPSVVRSREREGSAVTQTRVRTSSAVDRTSNRVSMQRALDGRPTLASWKTVESLVVKDELANKAAGDLHEGIRDRFPLEVWRFLKGASPGLCKYWELKLKRYDSIARKKEVGVRWIDVYIWAVLMGDNDLAKALLPKCREPLRAAILGARVFKAMAIRLPLHREALEALALEHEEWATQLLDYCEEFDTARHMLTCPSPTFNLTVLEVALRTGCRKCE